ncbi:DUF6225 family protein [Marinactinospora thermotolerans]|uniref:Uncharacterized protein n=1 Tax=Marinactinospora thermotolerans DSM 45154 TaxID=1122192 RepID=A0A1T4NP68_9ACTN|nr:DUF6225 family protein [Marinactinospora thermotolerans]SJZ80982.1 hypothetical protein SAMN02745673_01529 [Marinactinospora thermotolerans DSM 45154]
MDRTYRHEAVILTLGELRRAVAGSDLPDDTPVTIVVPDAPTSEGEEVMWDDLVCTAAERHRENGRGGVPGDESFRLTADYHSGDYFHRL